MKKIFLFLSLLAVLMVSCNNDPEQAPIETWTKSLMEKYPNFRSNEITSQIVKDSIAAYSESFLGKQARLFDGVKFRYLDMLNSEGDTISVMFRGEASTSIESDADGAKYIMQSIRCLAVGNVTKEVAANLSSGYMYAISGVVKELDLESSLLKAKATTISDDFYFGTFFIEDMKVEKIEE